MFSHLILLVAGALTPAEPAWLTVIGEARDASVNTVQVDPEAIAVRGDTRLMKVRVSRSGPRTSWDGIPYRSYESTVVFDCAERTARYQTISYFKEPVWTGAAFRTVDYSTGEPRYMRFTQVEPNPNVRIINAACGAARQAAR